MITTLVILAILLVILYKYVTYCQSYWKRKGIKGPEPTFLLGNFSGVFAQKESFENYFDRVYKEFKGKVEVVGIYLYLKPTLILLNAQVGRKVLVENFKNFHKNGFEKMLNEKSDPLLASNPFFLTGDAWKEKRSEVTPAFSTARIRVMFPLIESACTNMTEYVRNKGKTGETLEGRDLSSRFTCDVVTKCVFAADAKAFEFETPEIREHAKQLLGSGVLRLLKITLMEIFPTLFKLLRIGFVPKSTEAFLRDLMRQATEHRQNNNVTSQDYLEFLFQLKKRKGLTDLQMAASGITFFLDGLETSSLGIAHILFEIANNQEVQQKLRAEINEAVSKDGRLDYDTLVHLPYLDQVFHESLRMHPPVGFTKRECTEPIELNIGKEQKFLVEKGTTIWIPIWSIQHDPSTYDEPEKFKPERFNDGTIKDYIDKGQWLAFGNGPRTCLGLRFAKAQSKACVATIVKNFELTVNEKTIIPLSLDPKEFLGVSLGGIWLNFKEID